jgi:single-strand DNA-binding protein
MGIASTGLATSRKFTVNGEKKEEVCFVDITFFARSAEIANQYLRRGSKILIEGRLNFDQWVDQNGQKRSKHSVVVETMQMLDTKSIGAQSPYSDEPQQQPHQPRDYDNNPDLNYGQNHTDYRGQPQQKAMPDKNALPEIDIDEDEIPF